MPEAEFVESGDGTRIGYLKEGTGPGLVLVQGAMGDVRSYRDFAAALSTRFTVITAERRGRGLSPRTFDGRHTIDRDVEDVAAVMRATGAAYLFGLSSGAVITLEAARTLDLVRRAVVYEPPFYPEGISREGIAALNSEIENGSLSSALVGSLLTARTAPAVIRRAPRALARLLARFVLEVDARRPGDRALLRNLLPGVRYDFAVVAGVDGQMESFATIDKPVLVLSGSRSPAFLQQSARQLVEILADARLVRLKGLGHDGPWNSGDPLAVANAVGNFLVPSVP
ncbi:alpha/beta fold hydrolase [Nakamurella sp. YIM 132087]|uniref:Alpha/beta fold hydrolase n=1 Tax=Nakamurella alba TaxID=2665158 RepID=A0A7K1FN61_9ACTN|nr:alpha/beta hydrolase [Nakamurella alba]MTD14663.1 alpha/beta fold hydrolase [Nakamurella alba]